MMLLLLLLSHLLLNEFGEVLEPHEGAFKSKRVIYHLEEPKLRLTSILLLRFSSSSWNSTAEVLVVVYSELVRIEVEVLSHYNKGSIVEHRSEAKWSEKVVEKVSFSGRRIGFPPRLFIILNLRLFILLGLLVLRLRYNNPLAIWSENHPLITN
jgi:hypothetical protein